MNKVSNLIVLLPLLTLPSCGKHHARVVAGDERCDTTDANTLMVCNDEGATFALKKTATGIMLEDFSKDGIHFLDSGQTPPLFEAKLRDIRSGNDVENNISVNAANGWQAVTISRNDNQTVIEFSHPDNNALPSSLVAKVVIANEGGALSWDLKMEGLGASHSVLDVQFPQLALKASGNDHYFIPYRFGKVIDNPGEVDLDYGENETGAFLPNDTNPLMRNAGEYPKGWGATMQYMAYYNDEYGIYIGFHDPKANLKTLRAKSASHAIVVGSTVPAPDKTRAGNDFDYPGVVEFRPYSGDWYDAAKIYRDWVYHNADYRPPAQPTARAQKLAEISVWGTQNVFGDVHDFHSTAASLKRDIDRFYRFTQSAGVMAALQFTGAHGVSNEDNMPKFYPSNETRELAPHANGKGMATMVYSNGYLYSKEVDNPDDLVPDFSAVEDYAARDEHGNIYIQLWPVGDHQEDFVRMCPTQTGWVNILKNIHQQYLAPLHTSGLFIDQVTAASPVPCFNTRHGHPLGGGHYWRDGLKSLIETLRSVYPEDTFIVTEAVNDSLMDLVNGYETASENYLIENQVPAVQAVYGGKVQFIGPAVGTGNYGNANLFGISAYVLALGSTPGYFYPYFADPHVGRQIALRSRLKEYVAYGEMMRPPKPKSDLPEITVRRKVPNRDEYRVATISAIQTGAWKSSRNNSVALLFVNGLSPNEDGHSLSFGVDVSSADYGLEGDLTLSRVTADNEQALGVVKGVFPLSVTVPAGEAVAYVLTELGG